MRSPAVPRLAVASASLCAALVAIPCATGSYPLDGYEYTGIRRLLAYRRVLAGEMQGNLKLPAGALAGMDSVRLRLADVAPDYDILAGAKVEPVLQAGLDRIFGGLDPSYRVAVVDISDPTRPRFAAREADRGYIPGSVAKLLVMTGLFDQLARRYPDDHDARAALLRRVEIVADDFALPNHHTVPVVDEAFTRLQTRAVRAGDRFTLWEWADHMISPSSNAAASMVWREVLLMSAFGDAYPPSPDEARRYIAETPKAELAERAVRILQEPLERAGLDVANLRLGTFFTRGASRAIPGSGSYATPRELVRWLIRLEQGRLVDQWSSLEMKRLLYFTRGRYRYASAPALADARVYFKSGSLYECRPEPGYECGQYRGNTLNLMHSVAIVESPAKATGVGERAYLVAIMSDVRKVNSAVEHQTLATRIEQLLATAARAEAIQEP